MPIQKDKKPWSEYVQKTKKRPPRALLVRALKLVTKKENALDLGAGALNDSKYLLKQRFKHVTAVDKQDVASEIAKNLPKKRFTYSISTFEKFSFEKNEFDLISAQYSLPFIRPTKFNAVITKIKKALKSKAIFAGQFFGIRDEWNKTRSGMSFITREQIEKLFSDLEIIDLTEEEKDEAPVIGKTKHWHIFHFIVRKK